MKLFYIPKDEMSSREKMTWCMKLKAHRLGLAFAIGFLILFAASWIAMAGTEWMIHLADTGFFPGIICIVYALGYQLYLALTEGETKNKVWVGVLLVALIIVLRYGAFYIRLFTWIMTLTY